MVLLDNAATSRKPIQVLQAEYDFMTTYGSVNIHRGVCALSQQASQLFENSRVYVQQFINAASPREIVFNSGATAGLNFLAQSLCKSFDAPERNIIICSESGHSSAVVPFQKFCIETKKKFLYFIPVLPNGLLDYDNFEAFLKGNDKKEGAGKQVFMVVIEHINNALGTINDIERVIALCKTYGIITIIDACQSLAHMKIDAQKLDCDFMVFSSHKAFGGFGTGFIYAKEKYLKQLKPVAFGGGGVSQVRLDDTELAEYPSVFEVGTQNLSGVHTTEVGLRFLDEQRKNGASAFEQNLYTRMIDGIRQLPNFKIIGVPEKCNSIVSIIHKTKKAKDVSQILSDNNICSRSGFHCTHTLFRKLNIPDGTCRISLSFQNTAQEIDYLLKTLSNI